MQIVKGLQQQACGVFKGGRSFALKIPAAPDIMRCLQL